LATTNYYGHRLVAKTTTTQGEQMPTATTEPDIAEQFQGVRWDWDTEFPPPPIGIDADAVYENVPDEAVRNMLAVIPRFKIADPPQISTPARHLTVDDAVEAGKAELLTELIKAPDPLPEPTPPTIEQAPPGATQGVDWCGENGGYTVTSERYKISNFPPGVVEEMGYEAGGVMHMLSDANGLYQPIVTTAGGGRRMVTSAVADWADVQDDITTTGTGGCTIARSIHTPEGSATAMLDPNHILSLRTGCEMPVSNWSTVTVEGANTFTWHCKYPVEVDSTTYDLGFKTVFTRTNTNWTITNREVFDWIPTAADPASRLKQIIRDRMAPAFIRDRDHIRSIAPPAEIAARETLRRVVGEDKFRRFLCRGYISVKAKSGLVYQIFPGHGTTKVYRNGEPVETLCVVMKGSFPPTDELIMRFLLILNDEADFRAHANRSTFTRTARRKKSTDLRPLPQVLQDLRQQPKTTVDCRVRMTA
jgi:hypothetical protein